MKTNALVSFHPDLEKDKCSVSVDFHRLVRIGVNLAVLGHAAIHVYESDMCVPRLAVRKRQAVRASQVAKTRFKTF